MTPDGKLEPGDCVWCGDRGHDWEACPARLASAAALQPWPPSFQADPAGSGEPQVCLGCLRKAPTLLNADGLCVPCVDEAAEEEYERKLERGSREEDR